MILKGVAAMTVRQKVGLKKVNILKIYKDGKRYNDTGYLMVSLNN